MEQKITLNAEEMALLEIALESTTQVLKNRFEEEVEYVHPAKRYEELRKKLVEWMDTLTTGKFSISHEKIA